ncbi:unnamed protein product [Ceutorhynchus assimilis]|uniref:Uncharacterized protein n=1 Tax=Ceutorhynchus assimilis TaxID=467358 RepID=A0A9N9QNE0_9CUCU|nr:unnamed protein product [Ceutorhynchus assimilis]
MSTFTCEIIGTGDGKLENLEKTHSPPSTSMVKGIVEDIIENALDISENSCVAAPREKSPCFFGTGDQKSDEDIKKKISCYFPQVEKKTRLTDLVRNSKQILQKMMMSESKTTIQEQERKAEELQEKLIQAIDLDCIQLSDVQHKIKTPISPEEVDLPKNDSADILNPFDTNSDNESDTESSSGIIKEQFESDISNEQDLVCCRLDKQALSPIQNLDELNEQDLITSCELVVQSNKKLLSPKENLVESDGQDLLTSSNMIEIELNKNHAQSNNDIGLNSNSKKSNEQSSTVENLVQCDRLNRTQTKDLETELNSSQSDSTIKINQSDIIEIKLDDGKEETGTTSIAKRLMTLPRATTSKAKAALTAKCRTLKREATTLKKKKWNVSGRIANFFRKRRSIKKEQDEDEIKKET